MTQVKIVAFIDRPVADVYEYVTTPANWPQWHPSSLAVAGDANHSLQVGEAVTEKYRVAGREGSVVWTVSEREAPSRWTVVGQLVGIDGGGVVSYTLQPHGEGTLFTRVFTYEPITLLHSLLNVLIVRRKITRESQTAVLRLKNRLEQANSAPIRTDDYYFLDRWRLDAPLDQVWQHIFDAESYTDWWGEVYDAVEPLDALPPGTPGNSYQVHAHGRLPYKLAFVSEMVAVDAPTYLTLKAEGDLTGKGTWRLSPRDGGVDVSFEWIVSADKPLLRLLSPLLKPIFESNHRWTMRKGEAALQQLLQEQRSGAVKSA